jgi:hypothetical protein
MHARRHGGARTLDAEQLKPTGGTSTAPCPSGEKNAHGRFLRYSRSHYMVVSLPPLGVLASANFVRPLDASTTTASGPSRVRSGDGRG